MAGNLGVGMYQSAGKRKDGKISKERIWRAEKDIYLPDIINL